MNNAESFNTSSENLDDSKNAWNNLDNPDESWEDHLKKAIAETQSEANELYRSGNLSQQDFFNSDVSKKLRSLRKELADI